jgi:hypothetical protein
MTLAVLLVIAGVIGAVCGLIFVRRRERPSSAGPGVAVSAVSVLAALVGVVLMVFPGVPA